MDLSPEYGERSAESLKVSHKIGSLLVTLLDCCLLLNSWADAF